jgi:hypothetical protein
LTGKNGLCKVKQPAHLWSQCWQVVDRVKVGHVDPAAVHDCCHVIKRDAALRNVGGQDDLAEACGRWRINSSTSMHGGAEGIKQAAKPTAQVITKQ